jgi:hypothetical protein
MKIDPTVRIHPVRRERLDLEGAKMRYDEAWTEFLLWPDEDGRERVLERLVVYWRLRNRTSIGLIEFLEGFDRNSFQDTVMAAIKRKFPNAGRSAEAAPASAPATGVQRAAPRQDPRQEAARQINARAPAELDDSLVANRMLPGLRRCPCGARADHGPPEHLSRSSVPSRGQRLRESGTSSPLRGASGIP